MSGSCSYARAEAPAALIPAAPAPPPPPAPPPASRRPPAAEETRLHTEETRP
jgi:hypothetical protein